MFAPARNRLRAPALRAVDRLIEFATLGEYELVELVAAPSDDADACLDEGRLEPSHRVGRRAGPGRPGRTAPRRRDCGEGDGR